MNKYIQISKMKISQRVVSIVLLAAIFISSNSFSNDRKLFIYNWSDYIAPETIADFEKKTGIKVTYDVFKSNEELDKFLMTQPPKYDLVVPTSNFLVKQIDANLYMPLEKARLPNYSKNLDPKMLKILSSDDPDNQYSLPYMWVSTGIGYNVDKLNEIFNNNPPVNSWSLLFEKDNASKLSNCGIAWLEAPSELFSLTLKYLGKDPNSTVPEDYVAVSELLNKVSPYVKYIDSTNLIDDLANGKVCVAIGWSGDIYQAVERAKETHTGVNIKYNIPKEGTFASFDVFAIPKSAVNIDEAYEFLNYILEPQVVSQITNYVYYANPNLAANQYIEPQIIHDPNIYPPESVLDNLYMLTQKSPRIERTITRVWADILETRKHANLLNQIK